MKQKRHRRTMKGARLRGARVDMRATGEARVFVTPTAFSRDSSICSDWLVASAVVTSG